MILLLMAGRQIDEYVTYVGLQCAMGSSMHSLWNKSAGYILIMSGSWNVKSTILIC